MSTNPTFPLEPSPGSLPLTLDTLPLGQLTALDEVQQRVGLSDEKVTEYAGLYREGRDLGRLVVFTDGGIFLLADGFHRLRAAALAALTRARDRQESGRGCSPTTAGTVASPPASGAAARARPLGPGSPTTRPASAWSCTGRSAAPRRQTWHGAGGGRTATWWRWPSAPRASARGTCRRRWLPAWLHARTRTAGAPRERGVY